MTNNSTHLIQNLPSQHKSNLSRASTGQIIAYRNGIRIMFGEDPNRLECREFTSEESAMDAIRSIAHVDQADRMGKVCKDCGLPPTTMVSCPKTNDGAHRTEMRRVPEIDVQDCESRVARLN